jgi:hypothetical protein
MDADMAYIDFKLLSFFTIQDVAGDVRWMLIWHILIG